MNNSFFWRELTPRQVISVFLACVFLYAYPLVKADFSFYDDTLRSNEADANWIGEGRPLIQVYYHVLSFSGWVPNLFPLQLIISLLVMAFALRRLVFWGFDKPTLSSCLVVLPILYNPFFLQNLSYQYDGSAVALSLVAIIYAVTSNGVRKWRAIIISGMCVAIACALYQISLNFFIVFCCFEFVKCVSDRKSAAEIFSMMGIRLGTVAVGSLIYLISVYPFMHSDRQGMLSVSKESIVEIFLRSVQVAHQVSTPYPLMFKVLMGGLFAVALLGCLWVGKEILYCKGTRLSKGVLIGVYCLILPVVYFSFSGIALVFEVYNKDYRTLLGLSGAMVLVFFLSHKVLVGFRWWCSFVLVLPLYYSLSVSYAYGRILAYQKTYEAAVLTSLAYDIQHSELARVKSIHIINSWMGGASPASEGLYRAMPVLKGVVDFTYVILPEMLPRVGVRNVDGEADVIIERDLKLGVYKSLLETQNYKLYVVMDEGYVLMNPR